MLEGLSRRSLVLAALAAASVPSVALAGRSSRSIDQEKFIPLGGIEQWISIKGDDTANPVLLVVHGGPGEPQWPAEAKYKPWERYFTVVQWDQRGTGHTYGRYAAASPNVSLAQITKDGVELAEFLRRTLHKRKIIVLGHSWGALVAVQMAQMRPDAFAAYVGTGQTTSWARTVNSQFDVIRATAVKNGDDATVKELDAIGRPDPANYNQFFTFSRHLGASEDAADVAWFKHYRVDSPALEAAHPKDYKDMMDGMPFSGEHLIHDEVATDLFTTARRIDTAFFVVQGADDVIAPTPLAKEYFDAVQAPKKEMILIPNAGHFAFMTASAQFLSVLVRSVRPTAIARGA